MSPIYLDHNATTPLLPEVAAAMAECQARHFANPESLHQLGRRARQALDDAREGIAALLGAELTGPCADRLIFTSGGTESNNLAICGLLGCGVTAGSGQLIVSSIEHPSVLTLVEHLRREGHRVDQLPVSPQGIVRSDILRDTLTVKQASDVVPRPVVSVMLANNETGVLQPMDELASICNMDHIPLHTDAVQAVGKVPVNFRRLDVAAMIFAAHKFHGPRGIGGLLLRHDVKLAPQLFGGVQQQGLRPGTECVALAIGMHAALQIWQREQTERTTRMTQLRDRLEHGIHVAWPAAVVIGGDAPRLPNTCNIALVGLDRQALLMALDLAGVCCSTGSACASGSSEPSPALLAMQLPPEVVGGSLRFSLGATTSDADIDDALIRIRQVLQRQAHSVSAG